MKYSVEIRKQIEILFPNNQRLITLFENGSKEAIPLLKKLFRVKKIQSQKNEIELKKIEQVYLKILMLNK